MSIAALDNMLVDGRVKRDRIISVVARHAKGILWQSRSRYESVLGQIMHRIGIEIFAYLLERMIGRHELGAVWKIYAIDAWMHVRGAANEHMHFFRASF